MFTLSDGTGWAPEPVRWSVPVWTVSRCHGECEGLLLWLVVSRCRGCAESHPGWWVAGKGCLQFVQEVVQGRDAFLQAFALACFGHHLAGAAGVVERIPRKDLPVVKNALGEGLAASVRPQVSSEACGEAQGS